MGELSPEYELSLRDSSKIDFNTEKFRAFPEWKRDKKDYKKFPARAKLSSAEAHLIYRTAHDLGPGNYADVGVFAGGSTACLGHGLKDGNHIGTIYAIDWFNTEPPNKKDEFYSDIRAESRLTEYFGKNLPEVQLRICKGNSFEVGRKLKVPLNFAFIDASHLYWSVKRDFLAYGRLIKPGGMIAFHDCDFWGVRKVISQLGPEWLFLKQIYSIKLFIKTCRR